MLRLKYNATVAGAPSQYGDLADHLVDGNNVLLQDFPKAQAGFAEASATLSAALDTWLAARGARPDPVVVMVHGYLYDPTNAPDTSSESPFDSVYGEPPRVNYHLSWLPLVGECPQEGGAFADNAIAFCYRSIGGIQEVIDAGWGNTYQHTALDLSPLAARALAAVLVSLSAKVPTLRVLAHSLGTRTTSQAIRLARARLASSLDRIVLLDGAEFCVDAAANFANCPFDVFNILNRTDTVLRTGGRMGCHPVRTNGMPDSCVIGFDGVGGNDRWLDLQLDNARLVSWLAAGNAPDGVPYAIDALAREESHSGAGLDHWSCYTNDGNRPLVRDLLLNNLMTVARMTEHGVPSGTDVPPASSPYGRFNGMDVPATPQSRVERQRLLANASAAIGGA